MMNLKSKMKLRPQMELKSQARLKMKECETRASNYLTYDHG
jgi:hypothetical protein